MSYIITLSIGHNVGERKACELTHAEVTDEVADVLALQGYTSYTCIGAWQGVQETSTRIEICGLDIVDTERIRAAIPALCRLFGQAAIGYSCAIDQTEFISF